MVEFGEQLRRAREEKGMTQQSLAEQLYVTRQSVSRWECGDRYPDLITTTKIAQILEVSLDDLLSGKEMEKVVERNPVVENKTANNIMTALYAVTLLALTLPFIDALLTQSITPDSFKGNIPALIATVLKIIIFTYGLINAIKGSLSPKRMGAVIGAFFLSNCIANSNALSVLFSQITLSKIQPGDLLMIIGFSAFSLLPGICGAVAAFFFFIKNKKQIIWPVLIMTVSCIGILFSAFGKFSILIRYSEEYSLIHTLGLILSIAVFALIICQTVTLMRKRKNAGK